MIYLSLSRDKPAARTWVWAAKGESKSFRFILLKLGKQNKVAYVIFTATTTTNSLFASFCRHSQLRRQLLLLLLLLIDYFVVRLEVAFQFCRVLHSRRLFHFSLHFFRPIFAFNQFYYETHLLSAGFLEKKKVTTTYMLLSNKKETPFSLFRFFILNL